MTARARFQEGCGEVQEELRTRWLERTLEEPAGLDADRRRGSTGPTRDRNPLDEHLETCAACRMEAEELQLIEASLERSFRVLGERALDPDPSRIEETVRLVGEPLEADLIRKIRRPIRILLWIVFYLFTLLSSLILAVAVYKATQG